MAKGKYHDWVEGDNLVLLNGWARDGLIDEQIAANIGITTSTLYEWKKKFPAFSEALKKGKEICDYEVENALYKKALSGDVTAMIFWLKNRKADKWRDKQPEPDVDASALHNVEQVLVNIRRVAAGHGVDKSEAD